MRRPNRADAGAQVPCGAMMTVACTAALVSKSAEISAVKLRGAFPALLEKEIFENEPPLLRL